MKIFSLFFLLFICVISAQAQLTLTVTRSDDRNNATCEPGDCSLREAVNAANSAGTNDTINFAAGVTNITLTDEIAINGAGTLSIIGNGANVLTINGGAGTNRIFFVNTATVTISSVTLTGGNGTGAIESGNGGAIAAINGALTLDRVHVTGNTSTGAGGGVFLNGGTPVITNSTFSANTASGGCGGFFTASTLTVTNSTISGNTATNSIAGGFCNFGDVTLRSVTISNNTAGNGGGGIFNQGTLNFGNTIVAGNTTTTGSGPEIRFDSGTITSAGFNLVGDSAGDATNTVTAITFQTTDIRDVNPMLGPLQNNGGTTPTQALLTGSPAIDKGNSFGLTTDQRGSTRPVDQPGIANATGGNGADIGAFEATVGTTAASVTVSGHVMTSNGRGIRNAVVIMTDSESNVRTTTSTSFGYYHFDNVAAGETYILSVRAKRFNFTQQSQVMNINDDTDNINFVAYSESTQRIN